MRIIVKGWRGVHEIMLPLIDKPYQGIFDSRGKQIMIYYDQTGREDWLVSPTEIINALFKTIKENNND